MRRYLDYYWARMKVSVAILFQYRVAQFLWLVGLLTEPVIYLVVWSTIAEAQGGEIGGYTARAFAGYYIVWTLARHMNIALTPYAFEGRVQRGELSPELLLPIHPFHNDLSFFLGWKVVNFVLWVPIAIFLVWAFKPEINSTPLMLALGLLSMVTGFVMRFVLLWILGMVTFWVTRVNAVFEMYFTAELLLSGRLVPLSVMPEWAQRLADFLPYQWAFGFPIELTLGRLSTIEIWSGFGAQLGWTLFGVAVMAFFWPRAVKRYSAVGA